MKRKLSLVLVVAVVVLILDIITKEWIVRTLPFGAQFSVIDGFFDIVHVRNRGAAFGFLQDWHSPLRNLFFFGVGFAALVFLFFYIKSTPESDRPTLLALGLVLGGASGNLLDRAIRGSVVDFLSLHWRDSVFTPPWSTTPMPLIWPAFNVADSAISVAVVLLILLSFRRTQPSH